MPAAASVIVEPVRHRALGPMIRLVCGPDLLLTPAEALTLSRALSAVAGGKSAGMEIFLSPIASDGEFSASVTGEGVAVAGGLLLSWPEARLLSERLANAGG